MLPGACSANVTGHYAPVRPASESGPYRNRQQSSAKQGWLRCGDDTTHPVLRASFLGWCFKHVTGAEVAPGDYGESHVSWRTSRVYASRELDTRLTAELAVYYASSVPAPSKNARVYAHSRSLSRALAEAREPAIFSAPTAPRDAPRAGRNRRCANHATGRSLSDRTGKSRRTRNSPAPAATSFWNFASGRRAPGGLEPQDLWSSNCGRRRSANLRNGVG